MIKQNFQNKKIGILGFGTTGQSVLSFLSQFECSISITDKAQLNPVQKSLIEGHKVRYVDYSLLAQFIEMNDIIIPSPGVNIKPFKEHLHKFVCELDIFAQLVTKPTIAITGSAGKTSTVYTLTHILNKLGKRALACGNIGYPLLDALSQQDNYDLLVLELSSFQLQYHHFFKPTIAALTNIWPNHLDQHTDMFEYAEAKGQIFKNQASGDCAIIPLDLTEYVFNYLKKQNVQFLTDGYEVNKIKQLSDIIHPKNAQIILAILNHLNLKTTGLKRICSDLQKLEHRMELVGNYNNSTFYNDSKSTLAQATLSAVKLCKNKNIILFLGGLSKGIDRSSLIEQLKAKVSYILCFGKEANELHALCKKNMIKSSPHPTLESALVKCFSLVKPGMCVLFSPAGASFDLFDNYKHRGKTFKKLLTDYFKK